ncbi:unnamed protein product, partial [Rotaria socialis]
QVSKETDEIIRCAIQSRHRSDVGIDNENDDVFDITTTPVDLLEPITYDTEPGFTSADGWKLKIWKKTLTHGTDKKPALVEHNYQIKYLIHNTKGHVITSQHRAWNDTPRMCMFIDLILGPLKAKVGELFLWSDNCGVHHTDSVTEEFEKKGIHSYFYPPNMTGILQVLDLCVNVAIKQHVRKFMLRVIVEKWKEYQALYKANSVKPVGQREEMTFDVPKCELSEGLKNLFLMFDDGILATPAMKQSVIKTFINTGCYPKADGTFVLYSAAARRVQGTLKKAPSNIVPCADSNATATATSTANTTRNNNVEEELTPQQWSDEIAASFDAFIDEMLTHDKTNSFEDDIGIEDSDEEEDDSDSDSSDSDIEDFMEEEN